MSELNIKMQVEGATQQWVDSFMQNNNIPASIMEGALTKVLLSLKDKIIVDYLMEMQNPREEDNEEEGE